MRRRFAPINVPTNGGGPSTVNWGEIGGILSDQADLQAALDSKIEMVQWGDITGTLSSQTDLQTVLDTKIATGSNAALNSLNVGGGDFTVSAQGTTRIATVLYVGGANDGRHEAVTGQYGSVQVSGTEGSVGGGWEGYSIDGDIAFMWNGTFGGIFNDVDNHWIIRGERTQDTRLYNNGVDEFGTQNHAATSNVTGARVKDVDGNYRDVAHAYDDFKELTVTRDLVRSDIFHTLFKNGSTGTVNVRCQQNTIPVGSYGYLIHEGSGISGLNIEPGAGITVTVLTGDATLVASSGTIVVQQGGNLRWVRTSDTTYHFYGVA